MNCRRYERLLYLFRQGELEPGEQSRLEKHLRVCTRCSNEFRLLMRDSALLEGIRQMTPRPEDPDGLTRRILGSLPGVAPAPTGRFTRHLDAVMLWVERPWVRYASVGVVAGATLLFLFQQATLFLSLQELESRMARRAVTAPSLAVEFRVSKDDAHALSEAGIPAAVYRPFVRDDGTVGVYPGRDGWPGSVLDHLAALRSLEDRGTDIDRLPSVLGGLVNRMQARMTLLQQGG